MQVTVERTQNAHVVRVSGEVDMRNSPDLRKSLQELVEARSPFVVVNLSGIRYMDTAGIATLVECYQRMRKYKGIFRLAEARPETLDILKLAKLDEIFDIFGTEKEALE